MAIRYSGDTEIRVTWEERRRRYVGTVRDPRLAWRGAIPGFSSLRSFIDPNPRSSTNYDRAAKRFLDLANDWAKRRGTRFQDDGGRIMRVFQAPCPI